MTDQPPVPPGPGPGEETAPDETPDTPLARHEIEAKLRGLGEGGVSAGSLGEVALLLAALDRPRVGLRHYRQHLAALREKVAEAAVDLEPAAALEAALRDDFGYDGDRLTYDDLQNANLMRVIDRRRGLPVTLAILYLEGARGQGWEAEALRFPGHVLVRLQAGEGERVILDPFHGGGPLGAEDLRQLAKAVGGGTVELTPEHSQPLTDLEVVLRLQNNIKVRRRQSGETAGALAALESMLLLTPNDWSLWAEAAELQLALQDQPAAAIALAQVVELAPDLRRREEAQKVLRQLTGRLN